MIKASRIVVFQCKFVVKVPLAFSRQDAEAEARNILRDNAHQITLTQDGTQLESFESDAPGVSLAVGSPKRKEGK